MPKKDNLAAVSQIGPSHILDSKIYLDNSKKVCSKDKAIETCVFNKSGNIS